MHATEEVQDNAARVSRLACFFVIQKSVAGRPFA